MESKVTLRTMDEEKDEEWQPLNAMVTENLKNIIIRKIYKDVERNVGTQKKDASPVAHQYFAALGPIIAALSSGMSAGYSAILLPQLMVEDSEIIITKEEGSWIASMVALPLIFGCLVSGYLMDYWGRKLSYILSCVPFFVGWIALAFAPNVPALYAGRFITGFCVGLISPMCQVYIAETSQPDNRGMLLSGGPLAVSIGIFLAHILGTFFSWRVTAGICGLPPVICIALLVFAHESPSWLVQKGKMDAAEKAFRWFRGNSDEAVKEFEALVRKKKDPEDQERDVSKLKLIIRASFLKPFLVLNFFFFVQQFSGVNAVAFYSITILKDVLSTMNEYASTILIDVVRIVVSVLAVYLLKKFGRKTLSVFSAIGTAISLFLLTIYLAVVNVSPIDGGDGGFNSTANFSSFVNATGNETSVELEEETSGNLLYLLDYLPLVFLTSYICFVSIGLVPLPWVLTGELFSKEMRGLGSGGSSSFGFLCYFLVVKLSPDLFDALGSHGTFCFFGFVSLLGTIVLWLYLPETKDKTLMEIEAFYTKKKPELSSDLNGGISPQN